MTREMFIELLKSEQEKLRAYLLALCGGDSFLADDTAQEALVKAYLSMDSFLGRSKFTTWVFRIAYNCYIDYQRSEKSRGAGAKGSLSEASGIESTQRSDESFRDEALYRAIEGLGEREKSVVLLFYMEDLPTRKIAKIMGLSDGAVRSSLSRARGHLRGMIKIAVGNDA